MVSLNGSPIRSCITMTVKNVRKNLKFYGNPTLISSRPKHDIIESGDDQGFRPTISSQAGFSIGRASTK